MSEERKEDGRPSWEGDRYRRHVDRLESLPQNRSGADKTWVHRVEEDFREHFRKAKRVK